MCEDMMLAGYCPDIRISRGFVVLYNKIVDNMVYIPYYRHINTKERAKWINLE